MLVLKIIFYGIPALFEKWEVSLSKPKLKYKTKVQNPTDIKKVGMFLNNLNKIKIHNKSVILEMGVLYNFLYEQVNLQKYSRETKGWKILTRFDAAIL